MPLRAVMLEMLRAFAVSEYPRRKDWYVSELAVRDVRRREGQRARVEACATVGADGPATEPVGYMRRMPDHGLARPKERTRPRADTVVSE